MLWWIMAQTLRCPSIGAAFLSLGLGLVVACRPAPQPAAPKSPEAPPKPAALPMPAPPINRASLLSEVTRAMSAAATGEDDTAAQRELSGKRFELRIRFGCAGPESRISGSALGWTFDSARRVLRVRAVPTISAQEPAIASMMPEHVEAVQGFWIPRPWILGAACPAAETLSEAPADTKNPAETPPVVSAARVGIAQFFTEQDARTRRRDGRAYEATKTLPANSEPRASGFDLVLSGRLRAISNRVIHCAGATPDRPPDCVVSADIDRVRVETPGTSEILADWRSG